MLWFVDMNIHMQNEASNSTTDRFWNTEGHVDGEESCPYCFSVSSILDAHVVSVRKATH